MYLNEMDKPKTTKSKGLTLTWDVFKSTGCLKINDKLERLTLTWDVFKFLWFETYIWKIFSLTLTWDVFKSIKSKTRKRWGHV